MAYDVVRVNSPATWKEFLALPRRLYRHDPAWVPTIDREVRRTLNETKNPYFRTAHLDRWICRRDGTTVARCISVIQPAYATPNGDQPALFGFFDAEDDAEAVRALFDSVVADVRGRGATALIGPFHPHHYAEMGLQMDRFDAPPTFFQTQHRPYYLRLLEAADFAVERVIHTRRNPDIRAWLEAHPAPEVAAPGLTVRPVNLSDLDQEFARIREVYNEAFAPNCYFLPVSLDEYRFSASGLKLVTMPGLNVIVEHDGEPVGVLQCMLDVNPLFRSFRSGQLTPWGVIRFLSGRRRVRRLVVYAVGIKPAWQRSRVHALLFSALHRMAADFDELETTWMSPGNPISIRAAERFGMTEDKHFAVLKRVVRE